jgi:AcrR family transcriptional regulator
MRSPDALRPAAGAALRLRCAGLRVCGRRTRERVERATRARLLDAAAREFGRVGLERANIDSISLAAGYAKGTVYNYFASKEELFLAVVEEASARAAASAAVPAGASARERLRATLAAFCTWASEHEPFARVLVRECLMGTPTLHVRVINAEAPFIDELTAILAEGARRRQLRSDLPAEQLALAIAGLTDLALAQHWTTGDSEPPLEEIPELVLRVVLDGRAHRTSPTSGRRPARAERARTRRS